MGSTRPGWLKEKKERKKMSLRSILTTTGLAALLVIVTSPSHAQVVVSNGEPYQTEINAIVDLGALSIGINVSDVPAGKRLVIQSVNGIVYGARKEKYKLIIFTNSANGVQQWHPIPVAGQEYYDTEAATDATIFNATTYINALRDADGRILRVGLARSTKSLDHASYVRLSISGYLLSTP
jgi:hypothetical protein